MKKTIALILTILLLSFNNSISQVDTLFNIWEPIGNTILPIVTNDGDNTDGVGDGALFVNGQSQVVGQGVTCTFHGSMILGETLNIQTYIYNTHASYVKLKVELYNKTDSIVLFTSSPITISNSNSLPVLVSHNYTAVASDVGDVLQVRYIRTDDGRTARNFAIDNLSLNGSFISLLPSLLCLPTVVPDLSLIPSNSTIEAEINQIVLRYSDNYLGTSAPSLSDLSSAEAKYAALNINISSGVITGNPTTSFSAANFLKTFARHLKFNPTDTSIIEKTNNTVWWLSKQFCDETLSLDKNGYEYTTFAKPVVLLKDYLSQEVQDLFSFSFFKHTFDFKHFWVADYNSTYQTVNQTISTDLIYNYLEVMLAYSLWHDTPDERYRYMRAYKRFCNRFFSHTIGTTDGIKKDGSGFHHWTGHNAYMYAYNGAANVVYYLDSSIFQVDSANYKVFRDALYLQYIQSNDFGLQALSTCGRSPQGRNNRTSSSTLKKIAIAGQKILGISTPDPLLSGIYNRIYGIDPELHYSGVTPLSAQDGSYQVNYSHLNVFRNDNWLAVSKGFSNYMWGTEIYTQQNRYGRYQSYGTLEIIYPGNKETDNGYDVNTWDWNYNPGATTIVLPWDKLHAERGRIDGHQEKKFVGALSFKKKNSALLNKIHGTSGLFAMDFKEMEDQGWGAVHSTNNHNSTFTFKKSTFTFDDFIVCLASNINNNDVIHPTVTTLYQRKNNNSNNVIINNTIQNGTASYGDGVDNWLISNYNTGFYVVSGGGDIELWNGNQQVPRQNQTDQNTSSNPVGSYSKAYINHGISPNNEGYEYLVFPNTNTINMQAIGTLFSSGNKPYVVHQKDSNAHIIEHISKKTWGYSIFNDSVIINNTGLISYVDNASLIMYEINTDTNYVILSVCNPDLGLSKRGYTPSLEKKIKVSLKGHWNLSSYYSSVQILSATSSATLIEFTLIDGLAEEVSLIKCPTYSSLTEISCDVYTWSQTGDTYSISGVYNDTLVNSVGCDSIISLHLTVNSSVNIWEPIGNTSLSISTSDGDNTDGVGDGAIFVNGQSAVVGQGVSCTFTDHVTLGEILNIESYVYNTHSSHVSLKVELYNKTDSTVLFTSPSILVNSSGSLFSFSYTIRGSDIGDFLQVRYIRTDDGHTARNFAVDNLSINGSFLPLNLTAIPSFTTYSTFTEISCGSYTWGQTGDTYSISGVYNDTLVNSVGCDSIISLHLTVNSSVNIWEPIGNTRLSISTSDGDNTDGVGDGAIFVNGQSAVVGQGVSCTFTDHMTLGEILNIESYVYNTHSSHVSLKVELYNKTDSTVLFTSPSILVNSSGSLFSFSYTIRGSDIGDFLQVRYIRTDDGHTARNFAVDNLSINGSFVPLNLTAIPSFTTYSTLLETSCDVYTWSQTGMTYTTSGLYRDTVQNSSGCDSVITLDLSINNTSSSTLVETSCGSYTWSQTGDAYSISGVYNDTLVNSVGCDSIISLHLTVNSSVNIWEPIGNTSLSVRTDDADNTDGVADGAIFANGQSSVVGQGVSCTFTDHMTLGEILNIESYVYNTHSSHVSLKVELYNKTDGTVLFTSPSISLNSIGSLFSFSYTIRGSDIGDFLQVRYIRTDDGHTARNFAVDNLSLNGSFVPLNLTAIPSFTTYSTLLETSCDVYTWSQTGMTYTTSGLYRDTVQNSSGCDSVITLDLRINNTSSSTLVETSCDVYTWSQTGDTYSISGVYNDTLVNSVGCDSIISLHLTVNSSVNIWEPIGNTSLSVRTDDADNTDGVADGAIFANGQSSVVGQGVSCTFTDHMTLGEILNIESYVYNTHSSHVSLKVELYNKTDGTVLFTSPSISLNSIGSLFSFSYTIRGSDIGDFLQVRYIRTDDGHTARNFAVDNLSLNGSFVPLNLTAIPSFTSSSTLLETSCDVYTWSQTGMTYTTSGLYRDTVQNSLGCDSVITLDLRINNTSSSTLVETSCDVYTWSQTGMTYTTSGLYRDTVQNSLGCDSVITLDLSINNTSSSTLLETSCDVYTWSQTGMTYTTSGLYRDTVQNSLGCDSVITLDLRINNTSSSTLLETSCDVYTWSQTGMTYTTSGLYRDTVQNSLGCDSVITLDLRINNTSSSTLLETSCDVYTWSQTGMTYTTSGLYRDTVQNSLGCDSVITLDLRINNTSSSTLLETSCDVYTWSQTGMTYTTSGLYRDTVQNSLGCDSVITLDLRINNTSSSTLLETSCDVYTWSQTGMTYTTSGLYRDTVQNSLGCDFVITLDLRINNTSSSTLLETSCDVYTWSQTGMTYTTSGLYRDTVQNSLGCDSVITLDLRINNTSSSTLVETSCDVYTWSQTGMTYTTSGLYRDTVQNSSGCDSVITLDLRINNTSSSTLVETSCDVYTWSQTGMTYTTSGLYRDTVQNSLGCDSVITLDLRVNNTSSSTLLETSCDVYTWSQTGMTYTTSGLYRDTVQNSLGCDSVITLDLRINNTSSSTLLETSCDVYTWSQTGMTYTTSGLYRDTVQNSLGCDSVITLDLRINNTSSSTLVETSCDVYTWSQTGMTYTTSGLYRDTVQNSLGCDSVITLDLRVNNTSSSTLLETSCDVYTWSQTGMTYTTSGLYRDTVQNSLGCDSVITLDLRINNTSSSTLLETSCDVYTWSQTGMTYTTSGLYRDTVQNSLGCDSVITLDLRINNTSSSTLVETSCDVYTWSQTGMTYTTSGLYRDTVQNSSGCDSVITLDLRVNNTSSSTLLETSCDVYTWSQTGMTYTTSGLYRDTVQNSLGCDSVITLDLRINNTSSSTLLETSCDVYTWSQTGMTYTTSGLYRDTVQNSLGCDSVITLDLRINNTSSSTLVETSCDVYTWSQTGMTYTTSGLYRDTVQNSLGCDSVITLDLRVNNTSSSTLLETSCDVYTWSQTGMTYTTSGLYRDTVQNSSGCDSVITLDLRVNNTSSSTLVETSCDVYTWSQTGMTYTTSGLYRDTVQNSLGCDSVITLDLRINNTSSSTLLETSCDVYTWSQTGMTYTTSGLYRDTVQNSLGCDSVITLDLRINNTSSSTLLETSCDVYTWSQTGMTYTTSGLYRDTVQNSLGCDSVITLDLRINNTSSSTLLETSCDVYTWSQTGMTYTTSGLYRDTVQNSLGCDSVITLDLRINNTSSSTLLETSCDVYTWSQTGMTYTTSGLYRDTVQNSLGCDSVITLDLRINNTSSSTLLETSCDVYTWSQTGMTYTTSGLYRDTVQNSLGCDSVITLDLRINNTSSSTLVETSCDVYTWSQTGMTYTTSGLYRDTVQNSLGCDSVITLDLRVNNTSSSTLLETSCDVYTWSQTGMTYTTSGLYRDTVQNSLGCDSVITLDLRINNTSSSTLVETSCDVYTWSQTGMTYTTSGLYRDTVQNSLGCDSVITLDLRVNNTSSSTLVETSCDVYTWSQTGMTYTTSGLYRDTVQNSLGCDSVITLDLRVNNTSSSTLVETSCDVYTWSQTGMTYTTSGLYRDTVQNSLGCDSVITLDLRINNTSSSTLLETSCDVYTWSQTGMTYTTSGLYRDTVQNSLGCDSVITLDLRINNTSSSTLLETSCDVYTWSQTGMTYTTSGLYRDTVQNSLGCDSVITLDLRINNTSSSTLLETSCDVYTWSQTGMTYTTSGLYRDTVQNSLGCDSVITLDLRINNTSSSTLVETSCDVYTWSQTGMTYTTSGLYRDTVQNSLGCDSVITLDLRVNNTSSSTLLETSCDVYTWSQTGMTYTTSGLYRDTVQNSSGCDSVITLDLRVNNTSSSTLVETSCDVYTWSQTGMTYTTSGLYRDTVQNSLGCDSVITLDLRINNTSSSTLVETSCDVYTWSQTGMTYTTSGLYRDTVQNSSGCDSVITLDLRVNNTSSSTLVETSCDVYTWSQTGMTYTTSGLYRDTVQNSLGCDSVITLDLRINSSSTLLETSCDVYTWSQTGMTYTTSGLYRDTVQNSSGCDSVITLDLRVNNTSSSTLVETSCDVYTWSQTGMTYTTSGLYRDTVQNSLGCDSVITLDLRINNTSSSTLVETSCDVYTWSQTGMTYTTSGLYRDTVQNSLGCDSVITLDLRVNNTSSSTLVETSCDVYTWSQTGMTYTTSGLYRDTVQNSLGCDSVITLDLRVNNTSSSTLVETSCDVYTWSQTGMTYTTSGLYRDIVQNSLGCDSVITLDLRVNNTSSSTLVETSCDVYTWSQTGMTYTTSGLYRDTVQNSLGCDSVITLDLRINNTSSSTLVETSCDVYTWSQTGMTYTTSGLYRDTVQNSLGCDSVITLDLRVNNTSSSTLVETSCDVYTWSQTGMTYTTSGLYRDTVQNSLGCDSVITLDLRVNNTSSSTLVETSCDVYTWSQTGMTYTTSGLYRDTVQNSLGCDSVITLDLRVNNTSSSTLVETSCDVYTWSQTGMTYTTSGLYRDTVQNSLGCDSVITLDLRVNNTSSSTLVETSCDVYTWSQTGMTYTTSGLYRDTVQNSLGCDSVITLDLRINSSSTLVETSCDVYTWSQTGMTYTTSGLYRDTVQNLLGCDSVITLDLRVNNTSSSTLLETSCDVYTWSQTGMTYTTSGLYRDTVQNSLGCDSVITLDLRVNNTSSSTLLETSCDVYTWSQTGMTYTTSGLYRDTVQNSSGCDSVITLDLSINNTSSSTLVETSCDVYTWSQTGMTYTTSGLYRDTVQNSLGCDSVITLDLTITDISILSQPINQIVNIGDNVQFSVSVTGGSLSYQWQEDDGMGYSNLTNSGMYSGVTSSTLFITGVSAEIQGYEYRCLVSNTSGCNDTTNQVILQISLTDLNELDKMSFFLVYPNPTISNLTIKTNLVYYKIHVLNSIGQLVSMYSPITSIDVSTFDSGNYFIQLIGRDNEILRTEKFIKQ